MDLELAVVAFLITSDRHKHVGDVNHSKTSIAVLLHTMPENTTQDPPLLQAPVNCLMTGSSQLLHALVFIVVASWCFKEAIIAILVSTVSKDFLTFIQMKDYLIARNVQIWPSTTMSVFGNCIPRPERLAGIRAIQICTEGYISPISPKMR